MKKFLFSTLFLIPFWGTGQVYHPLVDSGSVWNQELVLGNLDLPPFITYNVSGGKFSLEGDTTIEGEHYMRLNFQKTYFFHIDPSWPPSNYGFNVAGTNSTIGAMREDSVRRIWFRLFSGSVVESSCTQFYIASDSDILLYDFNIQIGDTSIGMWHFPNMVTALDSIQLSNGEWRKRWQLADGSYLIEGIGSTNGLFGPLSGYFECESQLICFRKNNVLLYKGYSFWGFASLCDSISVEIQNVNSLLFTFETSPNPATDFLIINFSSPNSSSAQIKITDVLGRNLFDEEIKSNEPFQVSTEKLSASSTLFCQLWQDGKLIAVKKVLIER